MAPPENGHSMAAFADRAAIPCPDGVFPDAFGGFIAGLFPERPASANVVLLEPKGIAS